MRIRAIPISIPIAAPAALALAIGAPAPAAEDWLLMGREGGCVTLAEAAERRPLLDGITTPGELVDRLREQGEEVHRQDIDENGAGAVLVEAPGLGLGLVFVPPSLCR